jgi:TetR/AcrR family transcriptional repressor of lmrAB and yxaGH operons
VTLFRRNGYASTGLNDIVQASGAPKGSLYHYFPSGKSSIAVAAVEEAGRRVAATLTELATECATAADTLVAHAKLLAGWMKKSGFRDGCPITTVLLELAPQERAVSEAGRKVHAARIAILTDKLIAEGHPPDRAHRLAILAVSALQGALIQSRVARSSAPILIAAEELTAWLHGDRRAKKVDAKGLD